jgi:hypothetical protein
LSQVQGQEEEVSPEHPMRIRYPSYHLAAVALAGDHVRSPSPVQHTSVISVIYGAIYVPCCHTFRAVFDCKLLLRKTSVLKDGSHSLAPSIDRVDLLHITEILESAPYFMIVD